MAKSYKVEDDKKVTYTDAKKAYNKKVTKYAVEFSTSPEDQYIVEKFNNIIDDSGLSKNAYIKKLIINHVNHVESF